MTPHPSVPRRRGSSLVLAAVLAATLHGGCAAHHGQVPVEHFPLASDPEGRLPFADVVRAGGFLFQSGKLGLAPGKLELVPGGIQAETRATMEAIRDGFARHGVGMERVVKCTVFLADMKEWPAMNEVYVQFFPGGKKPARSALAAAGLALGARVEIECIAAV